MTESNPSSARPVQPVESVVLSYNATIPPRKHANALFVALWVPLGFAVGGALALLQISLFYHVPINLDLAWAIFCWTVLLDFSIVIVVLRMLIRTRRKLSALNNSTLVGTRWWICLLIGLGSGLFRWGLPAFIPRLAIRGEPQLIWLFTIPVVLAFASGILLLRSLPNAQDAR
jgi:hypothetical protein